MRGAEFGEVPGKVSPLSIVCAMGAMVPLCPNTGEIATIERTVQDLSPMDKSEGLGKICWYIKEPYGPPWDYYGGGITMGFGKHA